MNKRKKRRLIAYFLRTVVVLFVSICLVLMVCGCLYIHEHLHSVKVEAAVNKAANHSQVSLLTVMENGKYTVLLDPGHGGKDQGTCNGEHLEKDINLSVSLQIKAYLEEQGVRVLMTRETDDFIELSDRTNLANDEQVDLFVSIHCNYCKEDFGVSGLECYSYTEASQGRKYAEQLITYLDQNTSIETRGTKYEDFYVLRNTQVPAILVELGYMSNATECGKLCSKDYQKELSRNLAEAILGSMKNE